MLRVVDLLDGHLSRSRPQDIAHRNRSGRARPEPSVDRGVRSEAGKVFPSVARLPSARGLRVLLELDLREDLRVAFVGHEVPRLAAKSDGKFGVVRGLNDLQLGVTAKEPSRHQVAGKLGLGVSRRHVDDEPLELSPRHLLELLGDDPVVPPFDEVLVDVVRKRHEVFLSLLAKLKFALCLCQQKKLLQGLFW